MTKLDMLFIRACKVNNSDKRLRSVYKRFYVNKKDVTMYLAGILARICDENLDLTAEEIFKGLAPKRWIYKRDDECDDYYTRALNFFKSKIAFAHVDVFEGYIPPLRWRSRTKKEILSPTRRKPSEPQIQQIRPESYRTSAKDVEKIKTGWRKNEMYHTLKIQIDMEKALGNYFMDVLKVAIEYGGTAHQIQDSITVNVPVEHVVEAINKINEVKLGKIR